MFLFFFILKYFKQTAVILLDTPLQNNLDGIFDLEHQLIIFNF